MKLPWDKEKEALEKQTSKFSQMEITHTTQKSYNAVAGAHPSASVFDEIGHMNWRHTPVVQGKFKYGVKSYPDGSKYVIVEEITNKLTFKINSYEDLWILNQIHDVVKSAGWKVTVTIPNLIDAQADRRFDIDQPHGLKLVCEFLNRLDNFNYKIFHPHNAEVVEALIDRVEIIDNYSFIGEVMEAITDEGDYESKEDFESKFILMSSDAGGFKPLMKLADKLNWEGETFSASKSRKYVEGHSKLIQKVDRQDFEGKDILIIDDICVGGGTFKGLATMLKERNCGKLYLAVSHMTIQDLGKDSVTNYFEKVFTTNSKFDVYGTYEKVPTAVGETEVLISPINLEVFKDFN